MASRCDRVLATLADYAKAMLDEDESEQFEAHIASCGSCRREFSDFFDRAHDGAGRLEELAALTLDSLSSTFQRPDRDQGWEFGYVHDHPTDEAFTPTEGVDSTQAPRVGNLRIVRRIASGGMGSVHEAFDEVTRRRVAIKLLKMAEKRSKAMTRMINEAKAMARLDHPNIVAIHDVKYFDGGPALVMEFVDGTPLNLWQRGKPLRPDQAAALVREIALTIDHAHQRGVVHRDLKPSNILILDPPQEAEPGARPTIFPRIKLTDFGISQLNHHDQEVEGLTYTGELLGTPTYMSPEQTRGHGAPIGPASDIYNLGTILFELLCGKPPFATADPVETLMKIREEPPPRPSSIIAGIPKYLEEICLRCLAKSPSKRYASAGTLAEELEACLSSGLSVTQSHPVANESKRGAPRIRRKTATQTGVAVGLVGILLGGVFLFDHVPRGESMSEASSVTFDSNHPSIPPHLSSDRPIDQNLDKVRMRTLAQWEQKWQGHSIAQIAPHLTPMKAGLPVLEAKYPKDPQLIQLRGMLLESEGESARQVSDFSMWTKKLEQACSLAEKLTELTPNDPMAYCNHSQLLDQLAMAYRSIDDHTNMINASERSIEVQRGALKRWSDLPQMRLKMYDRSIGRFGILVHLELDSEAGYCLKEATQTLQSKPFSPKYKSSAESALSQLSFLDSELQKKK